ncbi:MAG: hypothetical protein H6555_00130 [Lewinellaceae bacterium]|nr:hypothetical protein [Lewinellaceae bacterium]
MGNRKNKGAQTLLLGGIMVLLGLFPVVGVAQEVPRLIQYTKNTYKAHSQNWGITQDHQGIIYAGNSAGLLVFDGQSWDLHPLPQGQAVRAVAADNSGRIYSGGFAALGYWEPQLAGRLRYISLMDQVKDTLARKEEIWHILPTSSGVYFQSFSRLYRLNEQKLTSVKIPGNIMFLQEVNGQLILPVINAGLFFLEPDGTSRFIPGSELFSDKIVSFVLPLKKGWLIGTERSGLFVYQNGQFTPWNSPLNESFKRNQLNRGIRLRDGTLVLGTILDGFFVLNAEGDLLYTFNQEHGLQNNTILALYEDRLGNIWSGLDRGIDVLLRADPLLYYQDRHGTLGTVYTAAYWEGHLYLGTNQGLFSKPWPSEETFRLIPGMQGQVWSLNTEGGELLCGHNNGTFRIRGVTSKMVSDVTGGWPFTALTSELLLQGTYTGLIVLRRDTPESGWAFSHRVQGPGGPIKALVRDKKGWFWLLSSFEGLYRFRMDADYRQVLDLQKVTNSAGLLNVLKVDLRKVGPRILVRTDTQLLQWDEEQGQLVIRDDQPTLLLPGKGQDYFRYANNQLEWWRGEQQAGRYTVNLVPDNETIVPLTKNQYLLCLEDGYALLDGNSEANHRVVTGAPLLRSCYAISSTGATLTPELIYKDTEPTLIMPRQTSTVVIHYALPVFRAQVLFRYRLAGWRNEWSGWREEPLVEFDNLSPGYYTFFVQSNFSTDIRELRFYVPPQWYQTTWMRLLFLLTIGGVVYGLFRWYYLRLDRQHRRQILDKERQLQQTRIQARNEQLQLEIMNKSRELANSTFNLIQKNESLMQIKDALVAMRAELGSSRWPDGYYRRLVKLVDSHLGSEKDWQVFENNFNEVHEVFFRKLKATYPDLTPGDLKLAAYLKMNLSSKEIAPLLNISIRGVENKRYRLRQKLELDADVNLTAYMIDF